MSLWLFIPLVVAAVGFILIVNTDDRWSVQFRTGTLLMLLAIAAIFLYAIGGLMGMWS